MRIKIVDFGLSSTYENGELLKTACGSPCYAAPEMIGGKKYEGLLADIWSSGIILYAMVCGFLPFEDANTAILYKKILSGEFEIPDHLSPEIVNLLKNVLQVDTKKRFRIQDIKQDKWFNKYLDDSSKISFEEINIQTLQEVEKMGISKAEVIKSIDAYSHNNYSTTYYLTYKKLEKQGLLIRKTNQVNNLIEIKESKEDKTIEQIQLKNKMKLRDQINAANSLIININNNSAKIYKSNEADFNIKKQNDFSFINNNKKAQISINKQYSSLSPDRINMKGKRKNLNIKNDELHNLKTNPYSAQ